MWLLLWDGHEYTGWRTGGNPSHHATHRGVRASLALGIGHPPFAHVPEVRTPAHPGALVERAGQLAPEARRQRVVLAEVGEHADHHLTQPVAALAVGGAHRIEQQLQAALDVACLDRGQRRRPVVIIGKLQSGERGQRPGMIGLELERLADRLLVALLDQPIGLRRQQPAKERVDGRPRQVAVNSSTSRPSRNALTAGIP